MKPSRAMIPLELLISTLSLLSAWLGAFAWPVKPGALYWLLAEHRENAVWFALLGLPAVALFVVSFREWHGAALGALELDRSCRLRARLVLLQGLSWVYGLKLLIVSGGAMGGVGALSIVMLIFCSWSYKENRRVRREIRTATVHFAATGR